MPEKDHDLLVRLDENVRNLAKTVTDKLTDHTAVITDHENRIRTLERSRNESKGLDIAWSKILTAVAAIGGLVGAIYWINH